MYQGEERRSYSCECGSKLYYKDDDGKVYCAMPKCHKEVTDKVKRDTDKSIPTYPMLRDIFNGKR